MACSPSIFSDKITNVIIRYSMKEEREIKLLINQKHYGFMNLQSGFVARYILAKIANLMIIHPIKEKREKKL